MERPLLSEDEYRDCIKSINESEKNCLELSFEAERWQTIGYYMDMLRRILSDCPDYKGRLEFEYGDNFTIIGYIQLEHKGL